MAGLGLAAAGAGTSGLTGWQSVTLGLGAAGIAALAALVGHRIVRRNASDNLALLAKHHDDSQQMLIQQQEDIRQEWGIQHQQWREDFDRIQARWQREQTFDLLDRAIERVLAGNDPAVFVGAVQLRALINSPLVHQDDRLWVHTVVTAALAATKQAVASRPTATVVTGDPGQPPPAVRVTG